MPSSGITVDPAKITMWTGDKLPVLTFTMKRDGDVIDLTSHTVTFDLADKTDRSLTIEDGSVTVSSPTTGVGTYTFGSALAAGTYLGQVKIVDASSRPQHSGLITIEVLEALNP